MAVPKKKTSKSRRDKRRAQHGIEAPRVNVCPTCGQPKRPHRICPNCKTYKGRDVEPLSWRTLVGGGIILASVALIISVPKTRGAVQRRQAAVAARAR